MLLPLLLASSFSSKGAVMLIGGSLSKEVLIALENLNGARKNAVLVLDPTKPSNCASELKKAGLTVKVAAADSELETAIKDCGTICIPSVKPSEFFMAFHRDTCQDLFATLLDKGVNFIGIDAGASLMGDPAFHGEEIKDGLGLIDAVVDFDHHAKHREIRLRNAYFSCRVQLGVGLDPGECLVLRDNLIEKKIGSPQVFLRESG